ncbi:MAG TPA: MlaD family protein [Nevskiaceae bacterium]|nr:MlaD family protein [Nevskiaceae bacterium]
MSDESHTTPPTEGGTQPPRRTVATFHKSWWPGWIWGIPVAAVGVVLWLSLRALSTGGTTITVIFAEAAGMSPGSTTVTYRGLDVGALKHLHLDASGQHVVAQFNIDDSAKRWLDTGTQFYLVGAHPSLSNPSTLKAIISGPSIVMVPGAGKPARRFIGVEGVPPLPLTVRVPYALAFDGAVGDLQIGAPVTLRGFTVGEVTGVQLDVDPHTGKISTPVTIALDPTRLHLDGVNPADGHWQSAMDAALAQMVKSGLRAALTRDPPLIGSPQVRLETLPHAPPATLVASSGKLLEIPTAPPSGPTAIMAKLNHLPVSDITTIANNVRSITARVNALVGSPQIKNSLAHLDHALAGLDRAVGQAGPQIAPTIASLRATAQQIDATARSAQRLAGGAAAPNGNVRQALQELTRTARAVRSLADYLERHPNALITGR